MFKFLKGVGHTFSIAELEKNGDQVYTQCGFLPHALRVLMQVTVPAGLEEYQLSSEERAQFQAVFGVIFLSGHIKKIHLSLVQEQVSEIKSQSEHLTLEARLRFVGMLAERYKNLLAKSNELKSSGGEAVELGSVKDVNLVGVLLMDLFKSACACGEIQNEAEFGARLLIDSMPSVLKAAWKMIEMQKKFGLTLTCMPTGAPGQYKLLKQDGQALTVDELGKLRSAVYSDEHSVFTHMSSAALHEMKRMLGEQGIDLAQCHVFNMVAPAGLCRGQVTVGCALPSMVNRSVPHVSLTREVLSAGGGWLIFSLDETLTASLVVISNSSGTHQIPNRAMREAMSLDGHVRFEGHTPDSPEMVLDNMVAAVVSVVEHVPFSEELKLDHALSHQGAVCVLTSDEVAALEARCHLSRERLESAVSGSHDESAVSESASDFIEHHRALSEKASPWKRGDFEAGRSVVSRSSLRRIAARHSLSASASASVSVSQTPSAGERQVSPLVGDAFRFLRSASSSPVLSHTATARDLFGLDK